MTARRSLLAAVALVCVAFATPAGAGNALLEAGKFVERVGKEAIFAVNKLIKPESVIASHANEEATSGGAVLADTKTARFIDLVDDDISVHVPRSDRTMEFNGEGECVAGFC